MHICTYIIYKYAHKNFLQHNENATVAVEALI